MEATLTTVKRTMNTILFWFAALLLIIMTLLVIYQVFTRYVLDSPADFTEELVRYFLIWTGFMGAAYAFSTRQHMALIFVRDRFPEGARRWILALTDFLVLIFALVIITIGGAQLAASSWGATSALLQIPRGLVYIVAPIAGAFIVVAQAINIYEDLTGVRIRTKDDELVTDDFDDDGDDLQRDPEASTKGTDSSGGESPDDGADPPTDTDPPRGAKAHRPDEAGEARP